MSHQTAREPVLRPTKSTIDRATKVKLFLARTSYRALFRVAPNVAEHLFAQRFLTPRRRKPSGPSNRWNAMELRNGSESLAAYTAGRGPAVLVIHGWESHAADLQTLGDALSHAGFRVVLVDLPAHGRSAGRRTNLVEFARVVRGVANTIGPLAGVVGHSLGAAAVVLAIRDGMLAARAVLIAPPNGPEHYVRRMASILGVSAQRIPALLSRIERLIGTAIPDVDVAQAAAALSTPALIFHDVADREVPFAHGAAVAAAWKGAQLIALENVGHRRPVTDPQVLATIVDFLRGNGGGREGKLDHAPMVNSR
jgi:pimeloyl-ACP methyl ester carboxylesterase